MLLERSEAVFQMNAWGNNRIPFVFIIDFEMKAIRIFRIDIPHSEPVLFDFQGYRNYKYNPGPKDVFTFKDIPDPEISDVLLVKKGLITDTSFSNIVLFDGFHWHTPATPILKGTRREFYIQNKTILPCDISVSDLFKYTKARLINAMLDLDEGNDIPVENLIGLG